MLVDFNFKFKNVKKEELEEEAALSLANFLSIKTPGISSAKAMLWVYKLAEDGKIEIDEVDAKILENLIEDSDFSNLAKDQFIKAIHKCK